MSDSTSPHDNGEYPKWFRKFKLAFVPLLVFSLFGQIAVVWTQLNDIRDGYFDFVLYHSAARILADGHGAQLYDLALQERYQRDVRSTPRDRPLPFNHLPYELLVLLPLAKLSFPAAHMVWAAVNFLLLVAILIRLTRTLEATQAKLFYLMLFAFFPTLYTLKMGQDSVITTYLLTETFIHLKHRHYGVVGSLLALGLYKPQLVVPIAAILFWHRRGSAILGFLLTSVALFAISVAMVGWQGFMGLLGLWLPMTERGNVVWPELMLNLRGLVYMTLNLVNATSATNGVTLVMSVLVFFLTLRCWPRHADEFVDGFDLQFALAVVMTALVSFHLYSYDGTILVLPVILTLNHLLKRQAQAPVVQPILLALLFVMYFPLIPNALLAVAVLAWWALPLPVLFCVIAREIRYPSRLLAVAGQVQTN
jgi:hypothetical protein